MSTPCVTLWIGARLGAVERACLKSIVRHGHSLALYCYNEPEGVPGGVEVRDAAAIIPEAKIIRYRSGSVALFSDWFRFELQRRACGIWVDADLYLLAPLPERAYLFGSQGDAINQAVLWLPADCPLIDDMAALFEEKSIPGWMNLRSRAAARWRLYRSGRTGISDMPWGTMGPHALTALAKRHGLEHHAMPEEVFYPVGWREAGWIRDPDIRLEQIVTSRTLAIHLWNERIKHFKDEPAPAGSFLARLQREGRAADC